MNIATAILSIVALLVSLTGGTKLGSSILTTNSSDTLSTFRTNVNASLTSLQNDKVSTTTAQTWTAAQTFNILPIFPITKGYHLVGSDSGIAQATSSIFSTSLGSIGIGTTTPNWLLQIYGSRPSLALSDANGTTNKKHWLFSSMNGNLYVGTSTDLYATTTSALTILNDGRVGLATTTPSAALAVTGKIYSTEGLVFSDGTTLTTAPQATGNTIAVSYATSTGSTLQKTISVVAGDVIEWWGFAHNTGSCSGAIRTATLNYKQSTMGASTTILTMAIGYLANGSQCSSSGSGYFLATTTESVNVEIDTTGFSADFASILVNKIH